MPLMPGDIQLTARKPTMVSQEGRAVPGYEIHFTIRGQGDYYALVAKEGLTGELAQKAILAVAQPILDLDDIFPAKL